MKLGIFSDCIHYRTPDGKVGTENHILLRQLQQLCSHFSEALICCPFAEYDDTKVISTYGSDKLGFHALPVVGGENLAAKFKLMAALPTWWRAYKQADRFSDIIYQRFPNNLNIPGFLYFYVNRKKVFATYTGTWSGYDAEAATYKLQRWMLRKYFRGPVWVYDKTTSNERIKAGFSPSYSIKEWKEETDQVRQRILRLTENGLSIYRFITVGTLIDYKNQLAIVRACHVLKEMSFPFYLTIVGDGPMRKEIEDYIATNRLADCIQLAGKKNHEQLRQLYREHDFVIQAPLKEGFGKVPIEGFFHGTIPIINNISMASYILDNGNRGFLFDAGKPNDLIETLLGLPGKSSQMKSMIENGRHFATTQTLEAWAKEYYDTVSTYYNEA
jgi:glycosyltransferase involved in cell wall biosynthesis